MLGLAASGLSAGNIPFIARRNPADRQKLASGLVIEDSKVGTGPVAKPGKRLSMR